jgi:hypothetical protein
MFKKGEMVVEKQYLWIAYLVFAVLIFLAAASFVRSNATKESFIRDASSEELVVLLETLSFSPGKTSITYPNSCCELSLKNSRLILSLPMEIMQEGLPFIASRNIFAPKDSIKGTLLLSSENNKVNINEKSPV